MSRDDFLVSTYRTRSGLELNLHRKKMLKSVPSKYEFVARWRKKVWCTNVGGAANCAFGGILNFTATVSAIFGDSIPRVQFERQGNPLLLSILLRMHLLRMTQRGMVGWVGVPVESPAASCVMLACEMQFYRSWHSSLFVSCPGIAGNVWVSYIWKRAKDNVTVKRLEREASNTGLQVNDQSDVQYHYRQLILFNFAKLIIARGSCWSFLFFAPFNFF